MKFFKMNHMGEAKSISENWEAKNDSLMELFNSYHEQLNDKINIYLSRYNFNKGRKVGQQIICPTCGKEHVKKSYQSQFCSNKGKKNCKDRYNNLVNDDRRERTHLHNNNKLALYFESASEEEIWEDEYFF